MLIGFSPWIWMGSAWGRFALCLDIRYVDTPLPHQITEVAVSPQTVASRYREHLHRVDQPRACEASLGDDFSRRAQTDENGSPKCVFCMRFARLPPGEDFREGWPNTPTCAVVGYVPGEDIRSVVHGAPIAGRPHRTHDSVLSGGVVVSRLAWLGFCHPRRGAWCTARGFAWHVLGSV